jgi:hypothetical protein
MKRGKLFRTSAVALFVLLGLVTGACASSAQAKPKVSLSFPGTAEEGIPISFSWTATRLGRGEKLVLQKPMGTAHTWRSVMRLHSRHGSAQLPGISLGKYQFRLAVLLGRKVEAQARDHVAVFGSVPFSTLFGRSGFEHVLATPSYTFSFVGPAHVVYSSDTNIFTLVNANHCRAVHIAFVTQGEHPAMTSVKVIQESREPVVSSVPRDVLGSIDAKLVPGQSWGVNAIATYTEGTPRLYFNGYAICDSTEPFWG